MTVLIYVNTSKQVGDPDPSSPHEAASSSLRLPPRQRPCGRYTAWPDAGTVPLLARFRRR